MDRSQVNVQDSDYQLITKLSLQMTMMRMMILIAKKMTREYLVENENIEEIQKFQIIPVKK